MIYVQENRRLRFSTKRMYTEGESRERLPRKSIETLGMQGQRWERQNSTSHDSRNKWEGQHKLPLLSTLVVRERWRKYELLVQ